jgi:hypothetical protein
MRYRLRTLLILMAVGPPLIAVSWFYGEEIAATACLAPLFGLWYWMLCKSQTNPKMRGQPNYDLPILPPTE